VVSGDDRQPDWVRQRVRADHPTLATYLWLLLWYLVVLPLFFVLAFWRLLLPLAIFLVLCISALVLPRAFSWIAQMWPPSPTFVVEVTVIGLALLVAVSVAHAVILTRPFPKPKSAELWKANHRLREIRAAAHSAIAAGRRR
jgi:hypothetical protein